MFKRLLGIEPQVEEDGSMRPSKLGLMLATSPISNYEPVAYEPYQGKRSKIIVLLTEEKNMAMKNGSYFSTGNHPVETFVPMLHFREAGFDFDIVTPTGKPAVFEEWAMPHQDTEVMSLYNDMKSQFDAPAALPNYLTARDKLAASCAGVFIPGGHGAMIGLPDDPNVGELLRWAHTNGLYTISLCHGPGAFLATALKGQPFLYEGYRMAVFPDSVDQKTPMIGYLPGAMPWELSRKLSDYGVKVMNERADDSCCLDRQLITGASPAAADKLGRLASKRLLENLA